LKNKSIESKVFLELAVPKNAIHALIAVADEVRESSKTVIEQLHQLGIKHTILLTGDNTATAETIGRHVGVTSIEAELLSQDLRLSGVYRKIWIRKHYP
jgi:P-type E1-E2 ATPase